MNVGLDDAGRLLVENDGAVHLRELAHQRSGELDVKVETTTANGLNGLVVTEDDERTGVATKNPLERVAHLRPRGDRSQRGPQPLIRAPVAAVRSIVGCHLAPKGVCEVADILTADHDGSLDRKTAVPPSTVAPTPRAPRRRRPIECPAGQHSGALPGRREP